MEPLAEGFVQRAGAWAVLLVLCSGVAAHAGESPRGIYVSRADTWQRVEFLPDGKCFLKLSGESDEGTFSVDGQSVVCTILGRSESSLRLEVQGDLLVDKDGAEWVPRDEIDRMPWEEVSPLTFIALDAETDQPITEFAYWYAIEAPGGQYSPLLARNTPVKSPDGAFTIQAPRSCQITLEFEGRDIIQNYGMWHTFNIRPDDERRIEVRVLTGVTVRGTVVDAATGQPVEGASIAPVIFTPPSISHDPRRAVKSDAAGNFVIHGVAGCLGLHASHPDYFDADDEDFEVTARETDDAPGVVRIALRSGEELSGLVKDPSGAPLPGVAVSDGAGKEVQTGEDGAFLLKSPKKWWDSRTAYSLSFEKKGFVRATFHPKAPEPNGLQVVLSPCPILGGTVVGRDGKPVPVYSIFVGPEPDPDEWQCTSQDVKDAQGRFSLEVRKGRDYARKGQSWVGVRAAGFAVYESPVDDWDGTETITISLDHGALVSGRVKLPETHAGDVQAELQPVSLPSDEEIYVSAGRTQRVILGTMLTSLDADGAFRFEHVRPGAYTLSVYGPGIAPIGSEIDIPEGGFDVGVLAARGTGTLYGQVFSSDERQRGQVWPFASPDVHVWDDTDRLFIDDGAPQLKPIPIIADEEGRFRIDGVPAGVVGVFIPYNRLIDVIDYHRRYAKVIEGQATEVRFFDFSDDWVVRCEVMVGDGSEEQWLTGTGVGAERKVASVPPWEPSVREPLFRLALSPATGGPISWPATDYERLDGEYCLLVPDVPNGTYRVRLETDGCGRSAVHEETREFGPGNRAFTVHLGAGCITGAVTESAANYPRLQAVAVGRSDGRVHYGASATDGSFCVPFLPPDAYDLYLRDPRVGWARTGGGSVKDSVEDVGIIELSLGAAINGKVAISSLGQYAAHVEAVDKNGVRAFGGYLRGTDEEYTITGLWPGDWHVQLCRNDENVIAEAEVHVEGTETVTLNLPAEERAVPEADDGRAQ